MEKKRSASFYVFYLFIFRASVGSQIGQSSVCFCYCGHRQCRGHNNIFKCEGIMRTNILLSGIFLMLINYNHEKKNASCAFMKGGKYTFNYWFQHQTSFSSTQRIKCSEKLSSPFLQHSSLSHCQFVCSVCFKFSRSLKYVHQTSTAFPFLQAQWAH